ncbi:MAG: DNA cytosine methyltransferase, partial [Syntrophomonadaceae bacterium]|nr:DNA cytosine methyltransferase [Syntrophomonadaceae bacterium]
MTYTCIDAFCGAGGLSLGLQQAGYDIVLSFDNDPKCIETHDLNVGTFFRHKAYLDSIESIINRNLLKVANLNKGDLFLLAGGPPCQGFSVQRRGDDKDGRNELVLKFISLVGELMPKYFLMENVRGIMGRRGRAILEQATRMATELGYRVIMEVLDAQDYGVPQRRERVFVVGERDFDPSQGYEFPFPTTPVGQRITVWDAIGDLPEPPQDGTDHPDIPHHRRDRLSDLNIRRLEALLPG